MLTLEGKIFHPQYKVEPITEPLHDKRGVRFARDYLNVTLDALASHYDKPDRTSNFGLVSFADHISPNLGTSAKIQWMLGHSGLMEHNKAVGVSNVAEQRLTDYGAEELMTAFKQRRELPANYQLGEPALVDVAADSSFEYLAEVPNIMQQRLGGEAVAASIDEENS